MASSRFLVGPRFGVWLLVLAMASQSFAGNSSDCAQSLRLLFNRHPKKSRAELFRQIEELYPDLTRAQIQEKIDLSPNAFKFYRAVVPLYYRELVVDPPAVERFAAIRAQSGWIAGDPHPENFGAFLSKKGRSQFIFNDIDDSGPGLLWADALRFFTSAHLVDQDQDMAVLIDAYKEGLKGKDRDFSKPVRNLMEESEGRARLPQKKFFDGDKSKLVRPEGSKELPKTLYQKLETILEATYGKSAQMKDAFENVRLEGGSGGLTRYVALLKFPEGQGIDGKHLVVEFKQMVQPGIFPLSPSANKLSVAERVAKSLEIDHGGSASALYKVIDFDGKDMLVRPRWAGNRGVKLEDYGAKEVRKIMADEAYVLGQIHARGANNASAYLEGVLKTPDSDWVAESERIAEFFESAFEVMK